MVEAGDLLGVKHPISTVIFFPLNEVVWAPGRYCSGDKKGPALAADRRGAEADAALSAELRLRRRCAAFSGTAAASPSSLRPGQVKSSHPAGNSNVSEDKRDLPAAELGLAAPRGVLPRGHLQEREGLSF